MAAEYVMSKGNLEVILCERGIRTFEVATRNTPLTSALCLCWKQKTHLPVVVDPSHGVGKWDLVALWQRLLLQSAQTAFIRSAYEPLKCNVRREQSLKPDAFKKLMAELKPIAKAVGREYRTS